jgi:hypothetical protein
MFKHLKLKALVAVSFAIASVGICNAQLSAKAPLQGQFDGKPCDPQSGKQLFTMYDGVKVSGPCQETCNPPYEYGQLIIPDKQTKWKMTGMTCIDPSKMDHCYLGRDNVKICEDQAFPEPCQFSADSINNSLTYTVDAKQSVFELSKADTMFLYDIYERLNGQIQHHPCSWKCLKTNQLISALIVAELKRRHENGWIYDKDNPNGTIVTISCIADSYYWPHLDPDGHGQF